jgi:hypothetical protein
MSPSTRRPVKIGAEIVRHERSIIVEAAEERVSRGLFQQLLGAIRALRPSTPVRC